MKCQFCSQELPDKAYFCFNCKSQIRCKECGESLISGADMCIYCGSSLASSRQENKNHIEFQEDEKSRKFSASFSDETAAHIANTFAQFQPSKARVQDAIVLPSHTVVESNIAIPEEEIQVTNSNNNPFNNVVLNNCDINTIFLNKNEKIVLNEKRLKAKSQLDYAKRLTFLFLLYWKDNGKQEIERADLTIILNENKLNSGGYRAWLSKASSLITIDSKLRAISLTPEGEENAKTYLSEVYDESVSGTWNLGQGSKSTSASSAKPSKQPVAIANLELAPKDKESLVDFMAKYKYEKSNPKIILLFTYYLREVINVAHVTPNHLFTCYKFAKISFPKNLYQTIVDIKVKRGWIENPSDIKITSIGYNEVNEMKK